MRGSERDCTVPGERPVIVMACGDSLESSQVGDVMSRQAQGCLIRVDRAIEAVLLRPAGRVKLVILDGCEGPAELTPVLQRIRRRWPEASAVVIGSGQEMALEIAARCGGASFLIRPVSWETWQALVCHATGRERIRMEERLG